MDQSQAIKQAQGQSGRGTVIAPGSAMPEGGSTLQVSTVNNKKGPDLLKISKLRLKVPKKLFIPSFLVLIFLLALLVVTKLLSNINTQKLNTTGKKGEIVWWGTRTESEYIQPLIEEYKKNNFGIEIKYIKKPKGDYKEKLLLALSKGEGPDIFEIHNSWPTSFGQRLDVIPEAIMSKKEYEQSFYLIIAKNMARGSGFVGIPLQYDAITLYINEDIFASAAKEAPTNWDDFKTLAFQFTIRGDQAIIQAGAPMGYVGNVDHWQEVLALLMFQNKVDLLKPTDSKAQQAMDYYNSFRGKTWEDILPNSTLAFAKGKLAMYFGPVYQANVIQRNTPVVRYKTTKLPQLPKDDPAEPDVSYATYWVQSVSASSVNKNDAWKFLKYLSRNEQLIKLNESYKKDGLVGLPYPKPELAPLLKDDKVAGSVVAMAPYAKSWFLAGDTHDTEDGVNSLANDYYLKLLTGGVPTGSTLDKLRVLSK